VCASWLQVQSYFFDDEAKKSKDRTRLNSSWAAEHLQADAKDLRKSYSSAKSICVSEEQETDNDWTKVSKHCQAQERRDKN